MESFEFVPLLKRLLTIFLTRSVFSELDVLDVAAVDVELSVSELLSAEAAALLSPCLGGGGGGVSAFSTDDACSCVNVPSVTKLLRIDLSGLVLLSAVELAVFEELPEFMALCSASVIALS